MEVVPQQLVYEGQHEVELLAVYALPAASFLMPSWWLWMWNEKPAL